MSIINSQPLIGASGQGGYFLTKSLRFRSSASAYLNRTLGSSGSLRAWTWSAWVKRGTLGVQQDLFGWVDLSGGNFQQVIGFNSDNTLEFQMYNSALGGYVNRKTTTQVFRDPSAWYHIVVTWDSNNATADDRARIYINGTRVTAWANNTNPSLNQDSYINNSSYPLGIGRCMPSSSNYFDGYLAEINFVNAQALTQSSFGETSTSTGVWIPKKYTGTYGTNGFYLPFTDVATTSGSNAGLGKDFSGNGNYWTTNNISVTTGTTYDSMSDVPTLTSATAANYCTLNPLDRNTNLALSNGNLTAIPSSTADYWLGRATMQLPSTGKWYWELTLNNTPYLYQAGIYSANRPNSGGTSATGNEYQISWGTWTTYIQYQSNNAAFAPWGTNTNPTSGDVLMFAVDSDNARMWVGRNGTWYNTSGTANPATNTDPRFSSIPSGLFAGVNLPNPASGGVSMNFGQQGFAYTPPTGFKALNTFNLPTPTIGATASSQAGKYFNPVLYSGNDSNRTITGVGFQPDFVWIKGRNAARFHNLFDAVRGAGYDLRSNSTNAEVYDNDTLTAFASDGFSLGTDVTSGRAVNYTGDTYVAWNWKANGSGSTNTAGSITSTVSANTTAGFSIATFTTPSGYSTGTVGHGLGVTPSMIIVKNRTAPSGANNWNTFHTSIGNTGALYLNTTGATTTSSAFWNNTSPTSSVFTIGSNLYASTDYVAYCFAQIAGYSAFGIYTGNGSSDGTFVYTGFRPRFVMVKRTDTVGFWPMKDTARDPYNVAGSLLFANASDAEYSNNQLFDLNSNGFKLRGSNNDINASGGTYIYMAFAESPFKYSLAR